MNAGALEIRDNALPSMANESILAAQIQQLRIIEARNILAMDPADMDANQTEYDQLQVRYDRDRSAFEPLIDPGRGLAVVASEVRGLAQRSAEAAMEIKALVSASAKEVRDGVALVDETGKFPRRIVDQVSAINAAVLEIAGSTQEQVTALGEVNSAINQMDQVTQQNAVMVEQSTAASRSLAGHADDLAKLVGQFQVSTQTGPEQSRPKPRAASTVMSAATSAALRKTRRGALAAKPRTAADADTGAEF